MGIKAHRQAIAVQHALADVEYDVLQFVAGHAPDLFGEVSAYVDSKRAEFGLILSDDGVHGEEPGDLYWQ